MIQAINFSQNKRQKPSFKAGFPVVMVINNGKETHDPKIIKSAINNLIKTLLKIDEKEFNPKLPRELRDKFIAKGEKIRADFKAADSTYYIPERYNSVENSTFKNFYGQVLKRVENWKNPKEQFLLTSKDAKEVADGQNRYHEINKYAKLNGFKSYFEKNKMIQDANIYYKNLLNKMINVFRNNPKKLVIEMEKNADTANRISVKGISFEV